MRMSCNGCRVLRKGCIENCILRPCLQWIKSPESQANATLFLAKFYGRAGLINLLHAGPTHLHPEIFRSLLYEACGRIINPVDGSVGLMSSGNWPRCEAAVEAVLQGSPLMMQVSGDDDSVAAAAQMPLQGCDIRHLSKNSAASSVHRIRSRNCFKRSPAAAQAKSEAVSVADELMSTEFEAKFTITGWDYNCGEDHKNLDEELKRAPSHDSFSVETVEPALANRPRDDQPQPELCGIELDLSLGLNPLLHNYISTVIEISDSET